VPANEPQLPFDLPNKVFFRIGEVSRLTEVKSYVLRYWETEFAELRPKKSKSGQRLYRKADVVMIVRLKELLWERGFTIKGARAHLRSGGDPEPETRPVAPQEPASPQLKLALQTRDKDLATVRSALVKMRSNVSAFLDDLSQ
jgi:DNA-binding transcriptional MerR regulator